MKGDQIHYKEGYKYQLTRNYSVFTGIMIPEDVIYDYFTITSNGWLHIKKGYAWDGASGPTFDTKSSMRASAVHDCYCQASNDKRIDYKEFGPQFNKVFYEICLEDEMDPIRAWLWHKAVIVGRGGDPSTKPDDEEDEPELSAP